MLPDPPNKKGFYSVRANNNKTFVTWTDLDNYKRKIDSLN